MPGPAPKPAATRQRTNKKSTAAQLVADPEAEVPILPAPPVTVERNDEGEVIAEHRADWHPAVLDEWAEIWRSPMAQEFIPTDGHGLLKYIFLVQEFWTSDDPDHRKSLHAEIRITRKDFGLTPVARASLHWEVIRTEEAELKRKKRRDAERPKPVNAVAELDALE